MSDREDKTEPTVGGKGLNRRSLLLGTAATAAAAAITISKATEVKAQAAGVGSKPKQPSPSTSMKSLLDAGERKKSTNNVAPAPLICPQFGLA